MNGRDSNPPENAVISGDLLAQVESQYLVVAHLAKNFMHLFSEIHGVLPIMQQRMGDDQMRRMGKSSAEIIRFMADYLNATDAVTEEDSWCDPVIERMETFFPANNEGQGCRASRHTLDPLVGSLGTGKE